MENQFTNLEISLIRSALTCKTDEEIAVLLDHPVSDIIEMINHIHGDAAKRQELIVVERGLIQQKEIEKDRIKLEKKLEQERKDERRKKREKQTQQTEKKIVERHRSNMRSRLPTRNIDLSQLVSVKLDNKTTALVKKGTDIEQVKKQYKPKLNPYGT